MFVDFYVNGFQPFACTFVVIQQTCMLMNASIKNTKLSKNKHTCRPMFNWVVVYRPDGYNDAISTVVKTIIFRLISFIQTIEEMSIVVDCELLFLQTFPL